MADSPLFHRPGDAGKRRFSMIPGASRPNFGASYESERAMYTFCSLFAIRSFLCTGGYIPLALGYSRAQVLRKVASVLIVPSAEMGEPQEAQPEPHEKSEPAEHHLFQQSRNRSPFHSESAMRCGTRQTLWKELQTCINSLACWGLRCGTQCAKFRLCPLPRRREVWSRPSAGIPNRSRSMRRCRSDGGRSLRVGRFFGRRLYLLRWLVGLRWDWRRFVVVLLGSTA